VNLVVPTVFLSRNHGAVVVRLDPMNRTWPAGQSPLAELSLGYTSASDGSKVTDSLEANYSSAAPLTDSSIFYSQRAVRKSVALVNEALAEIRAVTIYWDRTSDIGTATTLLDRAYTLLRAESADIEDADLATESNNVLKLKTNIGYRSSSTYGTGGSYGSTYSSTYNDRQNVACSFAAGVHTRAGNVWMWGLMLVGLATWSRRRRR
jgi:MYXO-CTERM domain-containing protein